MGKESTFDSGNMFITVKEKRENNKNGREEEKEV